MVNAIGLQGPGVGPFVENYIEHYRDTVKESLERRVMPDAKVPPMIVNIWGGSVEEYAEVAKVLSDCEFASGDAPLVAAIECNVSCPNVKEGGHTFGQDPAVLSRLVKAVRAATKLPLIVKLAPNVPDLKPYTAACEDNGADALALINTIPAMVIDIEKRVPAIANRTGGLSGRGIHPAAVKIVYDAHKATKLPILAMGGIYEAKDAIEFFLAGATAVAVGTAIFTDPGVVAKVHDGIVDYCERHGFSAVRELTGALCES
jgi:dihydroorotate dehydrogenase (NAD+) catalytic subunit